MLSQVRVLSIGQFRPEKDHPLQIKAMFELRQIITEEEWAKVKLVIVGGCRNQEDWKLVQDLKDLTKYLSVEENVEFKVNLPFPDLLNEFSKALIGIHTMHQEHFGIGIVEMMSAGLLTVANRSGGPLMDIVVEEQVNIYSSWGFFLKSEPPHDQGSRNGFLAITAQEYAAHIAYILALSPEGRDQVYPKHILGFYTDVSFTTTIPHSRSEAELVPQPSCSVTPPSKQDGSEPLILSLHSSRHRSVPSIQSLPAPIHTYFFCQKSSCVFLLYT